MIEKLTSNSDLYNYLILLADILTVEDRSNLRRLFGLQLARHQE